MSKFLLILLIVAGIAAIGVFVVRSRASSSDALPAADHPGAVDVGPDPTAVAAPPPNDVTTFAADRAPMLGEPELPVEEPAIVAEEPLEAEVVEESLPEPEPIVEPEPPATPEPIIEPGPEPVIEPEPDEPDEPTEPVLDSEPAEDEAPAEEPPEDEPPGGEPLERPADEVELPAEHLDPHAGWDHPEDVTVRGDPESGLYHTPDSPGYNVGEDGVEFDSEDAARTAGFTRWDQPG